MALPPSFANPEEFFRECITFLHEYKYLYNCPNTDILVKGILEQINVENLEDVDVYGKDFELPANILNNFFDKLNRLKPILDFEEECDLEKFVQVPLSTKKRHEVVYMAKQVKRVCEENGCDIVVDFGSGLGYLDQIIFETSNLKVLGLECDTSHYVKAKKRQGKYHPNSKESVKYINHTINEKSNGQIETFLHDKFLNFNGFCITGLHACADLTIVAMNLFLKMAKARAMVIMPCCYHKMELEDSNFKNFPLSNCFKELYRTFEGIQFMSVPFLRLGAQPFCSRDDLEDSVFNLMARAVLQLFANRKGYKLKRNKRKAVRTKSMERNFESYIHDACTGFRLIHNEPTFINNTADSSTETINFNLDEVRLIWHEMSNSMFKRAAIFVLLQNSMQPVIENLILYDRIEYLKEKGLNNCQFKKIVNEKISPRCLALLACKENI